MEMEEHYIRKPGKMENKNGPDRHDLRIRDVGKRRTQDTAICKKTELTVPKKE